MLKFIQGLFNTKNTKQSANAQPAKVRNLGNQYFSLKRGFFRFRHIIASAFVIIPTHAESSQSLIDRYGMAAQSLISGSGLATQSNMTGSTGSLSLMDTNGMATDSIIDPNGIASESGV